MSAMKIQLWIEGLGQSYDVLVSNGVVPDLALQELYVGREWLDIEPISGVELSFWSETKRLEKLFVTRLETLPRLSVYTAGLPELYSLIEKQSDVHALFGKPTESKGPIKMPQPMGQTGGWESYPLDPVIYPGKKVTFQYTSAMEVKTLVFTLIDKGHD
ncbi:DUF6392 family protein [Pseudomonas synxantha]|uniref:Uncharacterized protein n=1 Tax=Pseudomonas synxantha TaxID=47883 RepID=A0ACC6JSS1_9PSED|nr:hypothetical protein [Pseudomonas synxantha]MDR6609360.1 hypothetical protein [Pseudomonas synxantha]